MGKEKVFIFTFLGAERQKGQRSDVIWNLCFFLLFGFYLFQKINYKGYKGILRIRAQVQSENYKSFYFYPLFCFFYNFGKLVLYIRNTQRYAFAKQAYTYVLLYS